MDVSIVIVSWQVKKQLKNCLTSIYKETKNLEYEVFVVDNNSNDGSAKMVANEFSKVNLITNKKNYGFARACNQAIARSRGEYILLLNPDTQIINNAIKKTHDFMLKKNNCGIAGCKIKNIDGSIQPSVRKFPDLLSHVFILLKLHNFFPNIKPLKNYYCQNFDYNKNQVVEQIMGAFYMVSKKMIKNIGALDENYFIWYEEVDFCKRTQEAGWKTCYFSEASVMHLKGVSFSKANIIKKQLIFNRSLLFYFHKHKNILSYLLLIILYPINILLSLIVQISGYKKSRKDL